jgi:hypothetical protein
MSENNERKFYRGSAGWIIIGILAAVAVIFGVILAFGSMLFPSAPGAETQSETADQSATSGPGHNTTTDGSVPSGGQGEEVIGNSAPAGPEQIPDSDVTFGRETSTLETPQAGGLNNTANRTNGGLENPLSDNLTSLTGT